MCFVFTKSQAHEQFEEPKLEAVRENNVELVQDILKELNPLAARSRAVDELVRILKEPHFQVLHLTANQSFLMIMMHVLLTWIVGCMWR